ncbi:MAG: hypothetical protein G01um101470_637 [Parcubacteria group bacterium Gr01-1014_70]|nr:MAG: hypothetical protein G01um101470_637 [Parcubacteria group bacterium Gr01-1014_70]
MDAVLKEKLAGLGLSEDHVSKLEAEGVQTEEDLQLLTVQDIKQATNCGLIVAAKIVRTMAPVVASPVTPVVAETVALDAEIPEGAKPSPEQVNVFAASMGIDPSMLSMFMFANMAGGVGMDVDLSGMLPIPQIVMGYNPKRRDMPFMIMGQLERRLETPVVIINADGSVNHNLTVKYIMSLDEGFEPAPDGVYNDDDGSPYEVVRVGVDAQSVYDADPLDSTRALQKNHMGIGRIRWNEVSLEVRQVAFYAANRTKEIDPSNDAHLAWLRDHIKPSATRLVFQGQAPKAMSEYNEAARTGSLPTLRVMLGRGPRRAEFMPRRRRTVPRDLAGIGKTENEL